MARTSRWQMDDAGDGLLSLQFHRAFLTQLLSSVTPVMTFSECLLP